MHQDEPSDGDETSIPKMTPQLDAYFAVLRGKMATCMTRGADSARTSEYTVTDFVSTKRDKLWDMKVKGELVDSELRTKDGHRELLHLDVLLALEREEGMKPFYEYVNSDENFSNVKQYKVDPSIDAVTLKEVIFFAYKRQCTVKNALAMIAVVDRFHLHSLEAKLWQPFIEDHFQKIWTHHCADILELSFTAICKVLSWDRLDFKAEMTVWLVMQSWINARREERLSQLPRLIKDCLRIGRLPELSRKTILDSELIRALSAEERVKVIQHFKYITGCRSQCAIIDGYGLLYNKDIADFRPRGALHSLLVAAGGMEGRVFWSSCIEVYNSQINMWRTTGLQMPGNCRTMQFIDGVLYQFGRDRQLLALDLTQVAPTWTEKCPMIHYRDFTVSAALNGFLYALGGDATWKSCERYSPKLDRWELVADLFYKHGVKANAASFNGRIFLANTVTIEGDTQIEMYTPQTNTWQRLAPMLRAHRAFSLAPYRNRLWVIEASSVEPSCESYDTETNSWRAEDSLIINRHHSSLTVFNGQLILAGEYVNGRWVRSVKKYEQDQGWTEMAPLSQEGHHTYSHTYLFTVPNIYPSLRP